MSIIIYKHCSSREQSRDKFYDGDKSYRQNQSWGRRQEWMGVVEGAGRVIISYSGTGEYLNEKVTFGRNSNISFIPWEH